MDETYLGRVFVLFLFVCRGTCSVIISDLEFKLYRSVNRTELSLLLT